MAANFKGVFKPKIDKGYFFLSHALLFIHYGCFGMRFGHIVCRGVIFHLYRGAWPLIMQTSKKKHSLSTGFTVIMFTGNLTEMYLFEHEIEKNPKQMR